MQSKIAATGINDVKKALREDNLVVLVTNNSVFTKEKEYHVLLYKIDNDGKFYLKDPKKSNAINKGYNNKAFTEKEITTKAVKFYIFERY